MTSPASSPRRPHDRPMRHPFKFPHHLRKKGATRDRSPRYHLRRRVRPLPSPSPPRPRLRRNREAFIPAPSYAQASIVSHIWYVPPRSLSRCASVPHRRNHVPAGGQDTGCSAFENGRGQPRRDRTLTCLVRSTSTSVIWFGCSSACIAQTGTSSIKDIEGGIQSLLSFVQPVESDARSNEESAASQAGMPMAAEDVSAQAPRPPPAPSPSPAVEQLNSLSARLSVINKRISKLIGHHIRDANAEKYQAEKKAGLTPKEASADFGEFAS